MSAYSCLIATSQWSFFPNPAFFFLFPFFFLLDYFYVVYSITPKTLESAKLKQHIICSFSSKTFVSHTWKTSLKMAWPCPVLLDRCTGTWGNLSKHRSCSLQTIPMLWLNFAVASVFLQRYPVRAFGISISPHNDVFNKARRKHLELLCC